MRSTPIAQHDIESEIIRLSHLLEEETEVFERICEDEAKKSSAFKSAWAKEYLAGDGTQKTRESWATYKTSDLHLEASIAEGLMRAKREQLSTIRAQMDALRTLAANVRNMT